MPISRKDHKPIKIHYLIQAFDTRKKPNDANLTTYSSLCQFYIASSYEIERMLTINVDFNAKFYKTLISITECTLTGLWLEYPLTLNHH